MESNEEPSNPLPYIPSEIIKEILTRVQVKTLLRFRCVCKSWHSLISSSEFVKTHLNISSRKPTLLLTSLFEQDAYPTYFTCPLSSILCGTPSVIPHAFVVKAYNNANVKIVGICDGLFCLRANYGTLVLCNPCTRKFQILPSSNSDRWSSSYGFCYDQENDDYKIVELQCDTTINIYSLREKCWRTIFCRDRIVSDRGGTSIGGIIYWIDKRRPRLILAVDTVQYRCRTLEGPKFVERSDTRHWSLGDFGGCLAVLCCYLGMGVDCWVMKKESWTKINSIPCPQDGQIFLLNGAYMAICKFRDKSLTNCEIQGLSPLYEVSSPIYVESLVAPNFDAEEVSSLVFVDCLPGPSFDDGHEIKIRRRRRRRRNGRRSGARKKDHQRDERPRVKDFMYLSFIVSAILLLTATVCFNS